MSRLARLAAGVLAIALLVAVPTSAPAVPSSDATATKKRCTKGKTRNRSGKCVKKCKQGATRNRRGTCVKKKRPYTGPVPPDNAIGYNTGDGVAFVEISDNRTRISALVRVPLEKLTCTPSGEPPFPRAVGPQAHVYGMTLNPGTGEFAGSAPASDGGDGDSHIQGEFLSRTRLMMTATVSNVVGYGAEGDVCGGSNTVTVTLKPR